MARYTGQLLEQIERRVSAGERVNVTDWAVFYSLDVMASMSYSESFGLLASGTLDYYMRTIQDSLIFVGIFSWLTWLMPVVRAIPGLNRADARLQRFLTDRVEKRISLEEQGKLPDGPDVFSWILKDYRGAPKREWKNDTNLYVDAFLIVVAGRWVCSPLFTPLMKYANFFRDR